MGLGLVDVDAPPLSLADGVIELAEAFLRVPSGFRAGDPLVLSVEQIEWLIAWYAVRPDGLRYVAMRGHLEGPKGWAKSPLGMVVAFAALVGDVVPAGIASDGRPVGRQHPLPRVQIAGTSIDATNNLYMQLYAALEGSAAIGVYGLDVGVTKITRAGGGSIEPVTSSAQSRTGNAVTDILREETWLWNESNGGVALAATLNQNARKSGARVLDLTNTPIPGQGSVAERTVAAAAEGRGSSMVCRIRFEGEIEDINDDEAALAALRSVYGSHATEAGGWVDLEGILDDRPPGDTTEAQWRRLYLGEETMGEDAVIDPAVWWALERAERPLADGDTVALGFDGSDVSDATALYAVRYPDWAVFRLGVWERPYHEVTGHVDKSWRVPRAEVLAAIVGALERYEVVRGYADPAYWQTEIDTLSEEWGEGFMRFPHHSAARIGPACARWATMVDAGQLRHDGDETIIRHASNARREVCGPAKAGWWRPVRRTDGHPIDAFSAAVSAVHALGDALADGTVGEEEFEDDFVEVF